MNRHTVADLLKVMAQLRTPETGCPWDLAQNFSSIAPCTIEEAYEVDDAIRREDMDDLKCELGDLLFQVVYHSKMASESGYFTFEDVVHTITEKMIARHPHVFGEKNAENPDDVSRLWEDIKERERKDNNNMDRERASALDGVAIALPALLRAQKLQKRAARTGFDWPSSTETLDKVEEELCEVREALDSANEDHVREEFGDLMFAIVNLGRKLDIDAETSLRDANEKFSRRFQSMEEILEEKRQSGLAAPDLEQMEEFWDAVKKQEKAAC